MALTSEFAVDVLCVGHACYDLIFTVDHHPAADEKGTASAFYSCGGGPAANAAVAVSRLGLRAAFAGYLGEDVFGQRHFAELQAEGVDTRFVAMGVRPTPLSVVLVKPDGRRSLINYREATDPLAVGRIDFDGCRPGVILCDGHEPHVSLALAQKARKTAIPVVLDAGSLHEGTRQLLPLADYVVASQKFACQLTRTTDMDRALDILGRIAPQLVITMGERGLLWKLGRTGGRLPAFRIEAADTTGAGDAFHGAFAAGLAAGRPWKNLLSYASAAAALCCTRNGARLGLPTAQMVDALMQTHT